MRKDVADMWADALRSGKYKQTQGRLRDDSGYCCLGVLCDLHARRTNDGAWCQAPSGRISYTTGRGDGQTSRSQLTWEVATWAECRVSPETGTGAELAMLNDRERYTFAQLADLIQEQWKSL